MTSDPIRPHIAALELSGIGKIALGALDDPDVIPLWFGESDIVTPPFIREAAKAALDAGKTFYGYTRGHLMVREALHRYHARLYGLQLDPDRVSLIGSTMLGVQIACECLLEPGTEIILISPYWPNIRTVAEMKGASVVDVRLREGPGRWRLDMDEVADAVTGRTRAIYINSPSNPTGWVMSGEEQAAVIELCRRHGLGLIADEVYHRNVMAGDGPAPSFLTLSEPEEPVFVLNGFSKAWAMTGWRLGWIVHPRRLATPMSVLAEVSNTGAAAFTQDGAVAALDHGEDFVASFVARCRNNRDLVMEILGSHPRVDLLPPEGAFYAFPKIRGCDDGLLLAQRILAEAKVGTAAGYTFGKGNQGHLRLCFAIAPERLEVALRRIVDVLDRPAGGAE